MESKGYEDWVGMDAVDRTGNKLGDIRDVYYDDVSGRPEWVSVKPGVFKAARLVPIAGATIETDDDGDQRLVIGYDKDQIGASPDIDDADGHLTPDVERTLYAHYGFDRDTRTADDFGYGKDWGKPRFDADYDRSKFGAIGRVADRGTVEAEATVRNQEAQVVENTEQVRLRKVQHTEMVPVTKEEIVVERTDADGRTESHRRKS